MDEMFISDLEEVEDTEARELTDLTCDDPHGEQ